ncbi:GAF domain-containing protein [Rheinheimera texasensis]|uniref:GAF domain-containing protein n=1 Tax=Rheinheimera texasensis TaxID=306205 RepID=UPI00056BF739|nr:GAF domain-containing protein [Rheinheimera texasensis]
MDPLEHILLDVSASPLIDLGAWEQASQLILQSLQKGLMVQRVSLWLYDLGDQSMVCQLLLDGDEFATEALRLQASQFPAYFQALRRERAIVAHDARVDPQTAEFLDYLQNHQIFSMLDLPVRHLGKMIGIICCEHTRSRRDWNDNEVRFAAAMADQVGRALNADRFLCAQSQLEQLNLQLEQRVEQRSQQLADTDELVRRAHQQMEAQARLATLGGIVAGVAHEVNSPLGVALTANTLLEQRLQDFIFGMRERSISASQAMSLLEQMHESSLLVTANLQRAQRLMAQFKETAAHQTRVESAPVAFRQLVVDLLASLTPATRQVPVFPDVYIDPNLTLITAADVWLQILTNLVINSCLHAFSETAHPAISISATLNDQHELQFVYKDNGCGLTAEVRKQIFEPFFTTKPNAGGTGLGMSILKQLVEKKLCGELNLLDGPGFGLQISCLA